MKQQDQLRALVAENAALVRRYAARRTGPVVGEDIAADVWLAAVAAFDSGDGHRVGTAWLLTTARNKVADHWRRIGRGQHIQQRLESEQRTGAPGDDRSVAEVADDEVRNALRACPERHRNVLYLRYVHGYSAAETGQRMGVSASAVDSLVARARAAFRTRYEPHRLSA